MTLWLGQDGFDYPFQADYSLLWQHEIDAIREVCDHDPGCRISIEYKPNEPRSHSLMPDCATTLLAIREIAMPNLGVTLAVVTAGAAGVACAAPGSADITIPAVKVKVESTHGAGDTFIGQLAASLAVGDIMETALDKANRAAARLVGMPEAERLRQVRS